MKMSETAASPHPVIARVTDRIRTRSAPTRAAYLAQIRALADRPVRRAALSCGNLAHAFAACGAGDKAALKGAAKVNVAIVTAYNDMLSAHQPFATYPDEIKAALRDVGAVGQVAGGVPAMCDGVTQGQIGMELSLFSRDVIAMSTAVALSHDMFDAALCLGVCDKIVPGMLIGALRFGHLPVIFVPAGPMTSGLPNSEKAHVRQLYAEGKASRAELLEAESASYHGPGTCTFYGTANSNQLLMEIMGLHLPGAAFINPGTPLREAMTRATAQHVAGLTAQGGDYRPIGEIVDERAIVNAIVGLHATGGSTNHTIHLVAIARAAGILIDWDDFDALARATPLLARVYPNGQADVNHFHAAGGLGFVIRELLDAGLLHRDVRTVSGADLSAYAAEPVLEKGVLSWRAAPTISADPAIVRPAADPFAPEGGLLLCQGNLGRAIVKVSAVKPEHRTITAPAIVFESQGALIKRFEAGELNRDFVAVLRFQGPQANGMPELHKLTPSLGVLQDRGFKVALVTDGRMSGASGKVLAAIHVSPEAACGGALAKVRDGDVIQVCAMTGALEAQVPAAEWAARAPAIHDRFSADLGVGRELFSGFRALVGQAEKGALAIPDLAVASLRDVAAREQATDLA
jgi:phosphogluconate dehydratase